MKLFTALLIPLFISCSVIAEDTRPDEFPVVSFNNLKAGDFNRKISDAAENQEAWVYHPLLVIQQYRQISDARFVSILMNNDNVEAPLNSTITVVEEGYADDSVRGQWFEFHLERHNPESAWEIKEIRQANLCGRMDSPEEFSKELCP
jgi:hypothetical protein